jgi:diadenosine tetraphosphate (Ap4A) HIT family hydrolase
MTAPFATLESIRAHPSPLNDFDIAAELALGQMPKVFQEQLGRARRILLQTQLVALLPTVSPLARGHTLVFSRCDVGSFAGLLAQQARALQEFIAVVSEYETRFGEAIAFEHGCLSSSQGACGVSRAHIHLLPRAAIDDSALFVALRRELGPAVSLAFKDFPTELQQHEYIAVGTLSRGFHSWAKLNLPSQVVRRLISEQLNLPQWDWKELFAWELVERTIQSWGGRH